MDTASRPAGTAPSAPARKFGYLVAVAVNAVLLWVVHNLLDWEWTRFITEEWDQVLPILTTSLIAAIVVNTLYIVFDPKWFKSLTQIVLSGISLAVTVRMLRVFPFDFTEYDFPWETFVRVGLIVGIVGISIAIVVETVKLIGAIARG